MPMLRYRAAFAALVFGCMLSACGDPPEEQANTPAGGSKAPTTKVASIPMDMVAAVSAGKNNSAISVHFALRATPTVNTALPVEVAIVPHNDFSSLTVHFDSQDGLATTTGNTFGPLTDVKSESPLTHQLVLLPTKEGMFMVTAGVDTEGSEGNIVRIFSIPVIVSGTPAAAPAAAPATTPAEPAKQ